jgi:hypothetical protein
MIFERLRIPSLKMVTRACLARKSVTGTAVKEVSEILLLIALDSPSDGDPSGVLPNPYLGNHGVGQRVDH